MKAKGSRVGILRIKVVGLTGFAMVAIPLGSLAQGVVSVDDDFTPYGVAINTPGNYYTGTYGMEIWELNASTVPTGINLKPGPGSGVAAYDAMLASGFKLEGNFVNKTMQGGTFSLDNLFVLPDATPFGATVLVGLAVWDTSAGSWAAMLASANASTRAGVLAMTTPTEAVPMANPIPGPSLSIGWQAVGQDLVMTAIPEPGTFSLVWAAAGILLVRSRGRARLQRR